MTYYEEPEKFVMIPKR